MAVPGLVVFDLDQCCWHPGRHVPCPSPPPFHARGRGQNRCFNGGSKSGKERIVWQWQNPCALSTLLEGLGPNPQPAYLVLSIELIARGSVKAPSYPAPHPMQSSCPQLPVDLFGALTAPLPQRCSSSGARRPATTWPPMRSCAGGKRAAASLRRPSCASRASASESACVSLAHFRVLLRATATASSCSVARCLLCKS